MDFNEKFDKIWKESVDEYETIPDKNKISQEDREFARGYYYALDNMENIIDNYLIFDEKRENVLEEIDRQIAKKYDGYVKKYMQIYFDELLTSILDNYVE